jgi:hypothetical protein
MAKQLRIKRLDLKDPKARAEYERILKEVQAKSQPIVDAIRESQRITAADLAVTVNCRL